MVWYVEEMLAWGSPKRRKEGTVQRGQWRWMLAAALCVAMRPPSGIFWALAAGWYLLRCPGAAAAATAAGRGVAIGLAVLAGCAAWDRVWYGR